MGIERRENHDKLLNKQVFKEQTSNGYMMDELFGGKKLILNVIFL